MVFKPGFKINITISVIIFMFLLISLLALSTGCVNKNNDVPTPSDSLTRLENLTMVLPASLSQYLYREDGQDSFSLWKDDVNVAGLDMLSTDGLDQINDAVLVSKKDLDNLPEKAIERLYQRDYPAASGRTDTYEELHIGILSGDIWYDFWLDLRYGSEDDLMELVQSVNFTT
ncbi:MAG: hypothetical protein FWC62_04180 [Firmicutes bacterium]|nr:hypothetical protein [Bacillota bacterium]